MGEKRIVKRNIDYFLRLERYVLTFIQNEASTTDY